MTGSDLSATDGKVVTEDNSIYRGDQLAETAQRDGAVVAEDGPVDEETLARQAVSQRVRSAVDPLFRAGGQMSIIANTIHAAVMAAIHHIEDDLGIEPRDERADSIDPHSGAALYKAPAPEHDDETKAREEERIANLPAGKFGSDVSDDPALQPAPVQPEGAMVAAAAHPTGFGKPPVDPTQPPKSENDPKGPFALARDDGPGAGANVGGDAGKVQPTEFDSPTDQRSSEQRAYDDARTGAGTDGLAGRTQEEADAEAAAQAQDHTALD